MFRALSVHGGLLVCLECCWYSQEAVAILWKLLICSGFQCIWGMMAHVGAANTSRELSLCSVHPTSKEASERPSYYYRPLIRSCVICIMAIGNS